MKSNINLSGKKALITGGTRGIGLEVAKSLFEAGAEITVTGKNPSPQVPFKVSHVTCDFMDQSQVKKLCESIRTHSFDILVNNAGINKIGSFAEYSLEDWDAIQQVNLRVPFQLCQVVLPHMKKNRWGRIINVGSIFGKISKEFRAAYSASKFGLDGMTAALAAEVASHNILANTISPGFVNTELTRSVLGEEGIQKMIQGVPMQRLCEPTEIAQMVLWLVSPLNTFVSGQNLAIDGGFSRV